jgi:hypothetical protein
MNRKAQYLKNNTDGVVKLGDISFAKDEKTSEIKKLEQIKPMKFDLQDIVTSQVVGNNIDDYLITIKSVIEESVPEELRDFTIISIKVSSNVFTDVIVNNEVIKKDNVNTFGEGTTKTVQFSVSQYLNTINDNIIVDNPKHCLFLKQFLDSMKMYYGVSLNKSLINLKAYEKTLDNYNNKKLYTSSSLNKIVSVSNNLKNVVVTLSSVVTDMKTPSAYYVTITTPDSTDDLKLNFNKKVGSNTVLDEFDSGSYKNNILFYKPIDAYYYEYKSIPFISKPFLRNTNVNSDKVSILDEYVANGFGLFTKNGPHNDFLKMQE